MTYKSKEEQAKCKHENIQRVTSDELAEYWDICQDCGKEVIEEDE